MKNLRQELIDFAKKLTRSEFESFKYGHYELVVDNYLKSINSNEPNEFRAIGNNEKDGNLTNPSHCKSKELCTWRVCQLFYNADCEHDKRIFK